jgi:hypothetical protein
MKLKYNIIKIFKKQLTIKKSVQHNIMISSWSTQFLFESFSVWYVRMCVYTYKKQKKNCGVQYCCYWLDLWTTDLYLQYIKIKIKGL